LHFRETRLLSFELPNICCHGIVCIKIKYPRNKKKLYFGGNTTHNKSYHHTELWSLPRPAQGLNTNNNNNNNIFHLLILVRLYGNADIRDQYGKFDNLTVVSSTNVATVSLRYALL